MGEGKSEHTKGASGQIELIARVRQQGKEYRKTAPTKARLLTQKDFDERKGIIETKEGPVSFQVGDYLAVGVEGEEFPISKETMGRTKKLERIVVDEEGLEWGVYRNTNTVFAMQMKKPFTVQVENGDSIHGKAEDYVVCDGDQCWIVDQKIFETTYSKVEK